MKLLINITLSLILILSPAFSAAKGCCCANLLTQSGTQKTADSAKKNCHEELELSSSSHSHVKCQCDHQTSNSLPSITPQNTSLPLQMAVILVSGKTAILSNHLDHIYRPPIFS